MSEDDYDRVAADIPDDCGCLCRACRRGSHWACSAARPCSIAATCEDCGQEECICGAMEEEEFDTAEYDIPIVDDSPLDLSAIEGIINRIREIEL